MTSSGNPAYPAYPTDATASSVDLVTDLVETLVDGVRGYRTAADKVEDPALASTMRDRGDRRYSVTENIVRVAGDAGHAVDVDLDGTATGGLHRAWIEIEGAIAGDEAVVKSAIRGERHALEECEEALGDGVGEPIAGAVRNAAEDIRSAIAALEAFAS